MDGTMPRAVMYVTQGVVGLQALAAASVVSAWRVWRANPLDLNLTQGMILGLGALVVITTMQIECRLKTMQVRLAWMHDQIKHGEWTRDPDNHDQ